MSGFVVPFLYLYHLDYMILLQFTIDNKSEFGEVQFYFLVDNVNQNTNSYALVSVCGHLPVLLNWKVAAGMSRYSPVVM